METLPVPKENIVAALILIAWDRGDSIQAGAGKTKSCFVEY